jgi:hypothetical protein
LLKACKTCSLVMVIIEQNYLKRGGLVSFE